MNSNGIMNLGLMLYIVCIVTSVWILECFELLTPFSLLFLFYSDNMGQDLVA